MAIKSLKEVYNLIRNYALYIEEESPWEVYKDSINNFGLDFNTSIDVLKKFIIVSSTQESNIRRLLTSYPSVESITEGILGFSVDDDDDFVFDDVYCFVLAIFCFNNLLTNGKISERKIALSNEWNELNFNKFIKLEDADFPKEVNLL